MLHTHVASKNEDMNEMIDAHSYEMQCNYGSQTPEVLHFVLLLTSCVGAPPGWQSTSA
jgi:hypothetical protein